tara:strand:+ start:476 stop:616 length:141 start_codon:yes stop_codon:yes gene_type:complete
LQLEQGLQEQEVQPAEPHFVELEQEVARLVKLVQAEQVPQAQAVQD